MHYLDHAATTALRPEALAAMQRQWAQVGNPSSLHSAGRRARRVVEESREQIAGLIGARPADVIFTSGGTEADNLGVKGIARASSRRRVLVSSVEHHAVLDSADTLAAEGFRVERIPVDHLGRVDPDVLEAMLDDDVALVAVMWANNEVGTIQPIAQIAAVCRRAGVPLHCDAVQALGQLRLDVAGIPSVALSAHKVGGPVGVGALVLDRDLVVDPLLHGGGQERDVRSGTLNVAGIAGFAAALAAPAHDPAPLRDELIEGIRRRVADAVLNGDPVDRLANNAHFSFPGCPGDALLMLLDAAGIAVSTGSACTAGIPQPSHVLMAMGAGEDLASSSLRFSLGWTSTGEDVTALLDALPSAVERARRAGGAR
ncbi:MAG TPA: cysteine desulfurase family protein [Actinomycetota bacterium]|nr:cysteine desulfurase family protein [Actinomycetota bacterium]